MHGELVCAWCNEKQKDVQLVTAGKTHGICPDCLLKVFGFTVQQMYEALAQREEDAKIARTKKRLKRQQAKKRRSASVR